MRKIIEWFRGWLITWDIRLHNPELYRELADLDNLDAMRLTKPHHMDLSNFQEVQRPGE